MNELGEVNDSAFPWLNLLLMFIFDEIKKKNDEA